MSIEKKSLISTLKTTKKANVAKEDLGVGSVSTSVKSPSRPKFAAPSKPKFAAPSKPKFAAPSKPKFAAPSKPKFAAPSKPKFAAPSIKF